MGRKRLQRLLIIINAKTLVVTAFAVLSTHVCILFDLTADFPMALIATAVVFPIVFSINEAYQRRERALLRYSTLKSNGRSVFYAARDWIDDTSDATQEKAQKLLKDLLLECRTLFTSPVGEMLHNERNVYTRFSQLSDFINNDLGENGLPPAETSRCNQFLNQMIVAFEDIKHIYQYRTPRTLSAFSEFFVTVLPIVYGPYFAHKAADSSPYLAYILPILFTTVLVSLDNIQEHLENPFDQLGEDDIRFNAEKFSDQLGLK